MDPTKLIKKPTQTSCCVYGCTNTFVKVSKQRVGNEDHCGGVKNNYTNEKLPNVSFHRFPKNPEKLKLWTEAVNKMMPGAHNWKPSDSVICSGHFLSCDIRFDKDGNQQLKRSAVPYPYMNYNLSSGNSYSPIADFAERLEEDGQEQMEAKSDLYDSIDPEPEITKHDEYFSTSMSVDHKKSKPHGLHYAQIPVNLINELEKDIVQELSIYGKHLKKKLVDAYLIELADQMGSSVPKDVTEENICAIVTNFVAQIVQYISMSIATLKTNIVPCDEVIQKMEKRKFPLKHNLVEGSNCELDQKNKVHYDGDNELSVSFAGELARNTNTKEVSNTDEENSSTKVIMNDTRVSRQAISRQTETAVDTHLKNNAIESENGIPKDHVRWNRYGKPKEKQCPICHKWIHGHGGNYSRHMKKQHSNVYESLKCFECEKSFTFKCELTKHMKEVHRNTINSSNVISVKGSEDEGKSEKPLEDGNENMSKDNDSTSKIHFNATQRKTLLEKFAINNHPKAADMADIADTIGVQVTRVRTWFLNARKSMNRVGYIYSDSPRFPERNTPFNATQRNILLGKFALSNHPQKVEMEDIAHAIGEDVSRVQMWFLYARKRMNRLGYIYTNQELPQNTPRTCPVCHLTSTDISSDALMKSHLSKHLTYDINKGKIITQDGADWSLLQHGSESADFDKDQGLNQLSSVANLITFDDFLFTCLICKIKFINFAELKSHRASEHKDNTNIQYVGPKKECLQQRKYVKPKEKKRKICDQCGEDVSAESFRDHMRMHENYYKCDICHIQMANSQSLKKHKLIHTRKEGDQSFVCEVCGKGFWYKANLKAHMLKHTSEGGEYRRKCGVCNEEFTSEWLYQRHYEEHKRNSSIVCDICGESFTRQKSLKVHQLKTHFKHIKGAAGGQRIINVSRRYGEDGVPTYACQFCHKTFKNKTYLNHHEKVHTEGISTATCKICHKTFSNKYCLQLHEAIHSAARPYKCDICQMTFKQKAALRAHKTRHTGVKPYECSICHQRFRLGHILRSHYRIHTGEKPYHCQVCGQTFRQRGDLTQHFKRHASRGECSLVTTIDSKNNNVQLPAGYNQGTIVDIKNTMIDMKNAIIDIKD